MSEQPPEAVDLAGAEDATEDDSTIQEPGPSPYADPEIDTDQPQDETP